MFNLDKKGFASKLVIFSHLIIWLILLHLVYDLSGVWESFYYGIIQGRKFLDEAFLIIPSLVFLFYLNSSYLIPKYLNSKSWGKYLALITISFMALLFIGSLAFRVFLAMGYYSPFTDFVEFFDFSLIQHLIIIGISTSLGISKIALDNAEQKKKAIEKQREVELDYLKNQIAPHFLFNTLNTIYAFANEESAPKTTDAVLKLSDLMRYMVKEAKQEKVSLQKEIDFLKNYIDLQMFRLAGNVNIDFKITGNTGRLEIAPLLLISFVENTFKHGVSYQSTDPVFIEVTIEEPKVILKTRNTINKKQTDDRPGTGLINAQKRLNYLYPGQHELIVNQRHNTYELDLQINL